MESITSSLLFYSIFLLLVFILGTIYWVIGKFKAGAVISIIFSLLGPVIVIFLAAQRDTVITVYDYIIEEMSAGHTLARIVIFIHIYLLGWLLFIIGYFIFKTSCSHTIKEKIKQLAAKFSQREKKGGSKNE